MGDGWGDELHEAPLYIYLNSLIIHKANMPYKGGLDYKEDTSTFECILPHSFVLSFSDLSF